jgi:hypothetical protein
METTTGYMPCDLDLVDSRITTNGLFRISPKKSKTIEFFDDLYKYPPKFRVKWNTIDELHEDLSMSYNYRVINNNSPFLNVLTGLFNNEEDGSIKKTEYALSAYLEGYFNKITSTRFYAKQVKQLQDSLKQIPVYVVLNGQGEIVLSTSTDSKNSTTANLHKTAYEFCGSFDSLVQTNTQLGLFFVSRADAEVYLNEIAKLDTQGTKMFGLGIHCFGLDFAYRIMREYHPNIDFRFIPDLKEVQSLLSSRNLDNSNLIFENEQQQLRLRRRSIPLIPGLNSFNKWVSPFSSFSEKREYFKGVPIYIVKVNETPNNFFQERYYNAINLFDTLYGQVRKILATGIGFGNAHVLEGSINGQKESIATKTYVFLEKDAALEFCHSYGSNISKYTGSRSKLLQSVTKNPKIFVYNLEDFLETWEERFAKMQSANSTENKNLEAIFSKITIVPTKQSTVDVNNYSQQNKKSSFKNLAQFFEFKYRRLSGFMELLLNTN